MKRLFPLILSMTVGCATTGDEPPAVSEETPPVAAVLPSETAPAPPATTSPAAPPAASPTEDWVWRNPRPTGNSLYGVSFRDDKVGVAVGDKQVVRTTDGGASWSYVGTWELQ